MADVVCNSRTGVGVVTANFSSTENATLIYFTSDGSFEKRGFVLKYTENYVAPTTSSTVTSSTASTTSGGNGVTSKVMQTESKQRNVLSSIVPHSNY